MSDKCTSSYGKRRPFIVIAGILTILSMLGVAYAKELGHVLADVFGGTTAVSIGSMQRSVMCVWGLGCITRSGHSLMHHHVFSILMPSSSLSHPSILWTLPLMPFKLFAVP